MLEKAKKYSELAKARGTRVKECRKAIGLTQLELARTCGYEAESYISRIEIGERPLNSWDKAKIFEGVLKVPASYLLCLTDSKYAAPAFRNECALAEDALFLDFLYERGHDLQACIVLLYENEKPTKTVPLRYLSGFDFCNARCKCKIDGRQQEAIITDMVIDSFQMPFYVFCFIMDQIYRYIDFTLKSVPDFVTDFEAHIAGCDAASAEIKESYYANKPSSNELLSKINEIKEVGSCLVEEGKIKLEKKI